MGKTEVYSWRLSPEVKRTLEDEARRREVSVAELDQMARDWLAEHAANDDDAERVLAKARPFIGAISGGGARRSERVRDLVRKRLRDKHGR